MMPPRLKPGKTAADSIEWLQWTGLLNASHKPAYPWLPAEEAVTARALRNAPLLMQELFVPAMGHP